MAIAKMRGEIANRPARFVELDTQIRGALKCAIQGCSTLSREEIAAALSAETGTRITVHKLNHFTAESHKNYRFPAAWVIPFCRITGSDELQRILLGEYLRGALAVGEASLRALRRIGMHGSK